MGSRVPNRVAIERVCGVRRKRLRERKSFFVLYTAKTQHPSLRAKVLATLKVPWTAVADANAVSTAVSMATEHMRDGVIRSIRR